LTSELKCPDNLLSLTSYKMLGGDMAKISYHDFFQKIMIHDVNHNSLSCWFKRRKVTRVLLGLCHCTFSS